MGLVVQRACDVCGQTMPGEYFETRHLVVWYGTGAGERHEEFHTAEVCGDFCLAGSATALIRKLRRITRPGLVPALQEAARADSQHP